MSKVLRSEPGVHAQEFLAAAMLLAVKNIVRRSPVATQYGRAFHVYSNFNAGSHRASDKFICMYRLKDGGYATMRVFRG